MPRSVADWVGKTHDTKVPDRVRLRILEREDGRCHLSGLQIRPGDLWDLDHRQALCLGGAHAESNLFPALRDKHKAKTAEDVAEKATIARKRKKDLGLRKPSRMPGSKSSPWKKKMDGTVVRR